MNTEAEKYPLTVTLTLTSSQCRTNHENDRIHSIGESDARRRIYTLGGGQAYDRSNDEAAVVA
jgi:hypothetical protein